MLIYQSTWESSQFALSFRKAFLIEKGANPVHYIAENSAMLQAGMTRGKFYDQKTGNLLRLLHILTFSLVPKIPDGTYKLDVKSETDSLAMHLLDITSFLEEEVFSFIKFFDDSKSEDDPENYYMEREWRVIGHVNFQIEDVYRVIIPESYVIRFRKDVPNFNGQITFAE